MQEFLEASRPPDDEMVDLIESAFLEGQNNGIKADLAYSWLLVKRETLTVQRELNLVLFVVLFVVLDTSMFYVFFINNGLDN